MNIAQASSISAGQLYLARLFGGKCCPLLVVAIREADLFVISFDLLVEEEELDLEDFSSKVKNREVEPVLAAVTLDAMICNHSWKLLGDCSVDLTWYYPVFKIREAGKEKWQAINFWCETLRELEEGESARVPFRSTASPAAVEKTLCSHYGEGEWVPLMVKFLYSSYLSEKVFLGYD